MLFFVAAASTSATKKKVTLKKIAVKIQEIHLLGDHSHFMYKEESSHAKTGARDLMNWGIGAKIAEAHWVRGTGFKWPACYTREKPITIKIKLTTPALKKNADVIVEVTPLIDGSGAYLKKKAQSVTLTAGNTTHDLEIETAGKLPNEIGRYKLELKWRIRSKRKAKRFRMNPLTTKHYIYGIYAEPLKPDYDSASLADAGQKTSNSQGTLTATKKRFDHLMYITAGKSRRNKCSSQAELIEFYWKMHKGINDTPGAPPHFDAGHNRFMTHNGKRSKPNGSNNIPIEDQWLAWVNSPPINPGAASYSDKYWNDLSCIGHVQLLKTMAASIGLFARRTWIYPHTKKLPGGVNANLKDPDIFSLGKHTKAKMQTHTFTLGGSSVTATCKLLEPDGGWENFEACLMTPLGKFLPGGYSTRSTPKRIKKTKGFISAADLIQWWANTTRRRSYRGISLSSPFKRFMAWTYKHPITKAYHYWDVDGNHYTSANFKDIIANGKQLPPP